MKKYVIFIVGLPCSGKSTLAHNLACRCGYTHLATEELRAEYLAERHESSEDCDFTPEQHEYVYAEMLDRAGKILHSGGSVVIDGVYRNDEQRNPVFKLVRELNDGTHILPIYLTCGEEETLKRLIERKRKGTNAPAGVQGYEKIKREFIAPDAQFLRFDTTEGTEEALNAILSKVERTGTCGI